MSTSPSRKRSASRDVARHAVLPASLLAWLFCCSPSAFAAPKTDVVVMINGDRITGEVKSLEYNRLKLSTSHMGTLYIEWDKVARATSAFVFEVEMSSGERHYGVLSSPSDQELAVGLLPAAQVVPTSAVVQIVPMDDDFLGRVRAIFDLGFTIAKANGATTFSTSGEVTYRAKWLGSKLSFDVYLQDDDSNVAVSRYTAALSGDVYFVDHWRAFLGAEVSHNDQLGLQLRTSLNTGAGYSAVRNGWTELWLSAGLVGSRERYATGDPNLTLDGLVAASWDAFRYDTPKLDLTAELALYPGLSDWGRLRGTFTFRIRYEVIRDFNVGLVFQDTFDTRPPDPTASKNDYIAQLTIGWSYRR